MAITITRPKTKITRKHKTTLIIEPTETQVHLNNMLDRVREGSWTRGTVYNVHTKQRCALGLISQELGIAVH